jgi:gliding motility-associated lipoprotein GldD
MSRFSIFFLVAISLGSCTKSVSDSDYAPKPEGYPRIDLPAHAYRSLEAGHPYQFEYSKYAVILPDTFVDSEPDWIFVAYPQWGANIQLTYKRTQNDPKRLSAFINDAYKLTAAHQKKASGITEATIKTKSGKTAVLIELAGDVPSYLQFYTTDTTKHYLRGALYFNIAEKQDSLAPVIDYLKKDMMKMLNTLQWKN